MAEYNFSSALFIPTGYFDPTHRTTRHRKWQDISSWHIQRNIAHAVHTALHPRLKHF
jgi:hypothetical protein